MHINRHDKDADGNVWSAYLESCHVSSDLVERPLLIFFFFFNKQSTTSRTDAGYHRRLLLLGEFIFAWPSILFSTAILNKLFFTLGVKHTNRYAFKLYDMYNRDSRVFDLIKKKCCTRTGSWRAGCRSMERLFDYLNRVSFKKFWCTAIILLSIAIFPSIINVPRQDVCTDSKWSVCEIQ